MTPNQKSTISNWLGLEWGDRHSLDEYTDDEVVQYLMDAFSDLQHDYSVACNKINRITKLVVSLAHEYGVDRL
jgi:hypothetical protein